MVDLGIPVIWVFLSHITFNSLFSLSRHQKLKANHSIETVQNLENERKYIHKKPRQESGLYDISYARYSEKKRLTQIYKAFYGDAMLVSL